jgi:ABC exporter DevB family membrane fusion protein
MTQNKARLGLVLSAALALGLITIIVRSVLAGPQTIPTRADVERAKIPVAPAAGVDEQSQVPRGDFVAGNGVVEPREREIKVAGEVAGRIKRVLVREGQQVAAGAVLIELENGSELAALAAAQAELETTRAELTRTMRGLRKEDVEAVVADTAALAARAQLSTTSLARTQALAKTGAATPDELDRAQHQAETDARALEAAEARRRSALSGARAEDILVARAKVAAAGARLGEAEARLARLLVKAPSAGEILQLKVRAGEYYAPGASEPLLVLGDTSSLRVRVDVDERDVQRVKAGAPAFVTLNAYPGRRIPGTVVEVGRRMGRKNIRTDDPVERIDTKILEVVVELGERAGLVPGLRVVGYIAAK